MKQTYIAHLQRGLLLCMLLLLGGCATTSQYGENDAIEPVNRAFFTFNDKLDRYLVKPTAQGYVKVTPKRVRHSVTNFFDNLFYPNVILNDFLQGKLTQGVRDVARLVVNTTAGVGGLFDPAARIGLKEHNEDLGQTLATWGVGEGSFLNLPLFGPSSVRDSPDIAMGSVLSPLLYIGAIVAFPVAAVNVINKRANLLEATQIRDEAALDSYTFTREAYRQRRRALIYDGAPPPEEFADFFEDEE